MTLPPTPHEPPDETRHFRRPRLTWPRLAERILGGWGPTLRSATLLVVILAAGITCVIAAWGVYGIASALVLCAILHRAMSRLDRPLQI